MLNPLQKKWLADLERDIPRFLASLARPGGPGRFAPCGRGVSRDGRRVALGFSCLALKIYSMLNLWEKLPRRERRQWLDFIKSFQTEDGSFRDPALAGALRRGPRGLGRLRRWLGRSAPPPPLEAVVNAETKQALATLAEMGGAPERPFQDFPSRPREARRWLEALPWDQPWVAGGRAAALAVFARTQAPAFLAPSEARELLDVQAAFYQELADPASGAYFRGDEPERDQLINGAMKVLTALDWLDAPISHPESLMDACLERLPSSEGCHLVDWVYVIHRCLGRTDHGRSRATRACLEVLEMIREHQRPEGGFSYYLGRCQTNYYGVEIARGLAQADLHGTCLLVWALAMIREIAGDAGVWRVIKP